MTDNMLQARQFLDNARQAAGCYIVGFNSNREICIIYKWFPNHWLADAWIRVQPKERHTHVHYIINNRPESIRGVRLSSDVVISEELK